MSKNWLQNLKNGPVTFSNHYDYDEDMAVIAMLSEAMDGGPVVYRYKKVGLISNSFQKISSTLTEGLSGRLIYQNVSADKLYPKQIVQWDHGMVVLDWYHSGNDWMKMSVASTDKAFVEKVTAFAEIELSKNNGAGRVYAVSQGPDGPFLSDVGVAGVALVRDNYSDLVLEHYDHVVADLSSKEPCGRLVIMNGVAGSGKTHIVKALLSEVKDTPFIVIPSHMVASLADPGFVQVLIDAREESLNKPLVLIVEDADACLIERQSDNISSINTLLNLSDGIIGSVLDIRVIATTNAESLDLDAAIIRPGRLCTRFDVDALPAKHANAVYKRLTGEDGNFGEATLGDIYQAAKRGFGVAKNKKGHKKSGFSMG
jgi:hypothetical protein